MAVKQNTIHRQAGVSIISMMIGLFISMLCILASLTLYKDLITVATEGKLDNLYDGQLASVFMVAQMEIQNTGYGINDADLDDIKTIYTANGPHSSSKNSLVWRYKDGANDICEGIVEETVQLTLEDNETYLYRQLAKKKASSGCTDSVDLTTLNYDTTESVLARFQTVGVLEEHLKNADLLSFAINPVDCSPFGAVTPARHLQITITAPSSTTLNSAGTAENQLTLCLPNTYPS